MEQNYSVIAVEALRTEMARKNIKAKQVSEMTGIPPATLSNLLSGSVSQPSFTAIYACAKAVQTTVDVLMGDHHTHVVSNDKIIDGYERRLEERREMCDLRLREQERMYEARLADREKRSQDVREQYERQLSNHKSIISVYRRRNNMFLGVIAVLVAFLLFLLFVDAKHGGWGFIQYDELAALFGSETSVRI